MSAGNRFYRSIYATRVDAALAACRTVSQLTHHGEQGRIREILISALFRPLLPADLGIGTGFVISTGGEVSSQQDVILYDRATLPPALFDESTGFFPVESVLQTIEIKTTLTRADLIQTHNSAHNMDHFTLVDSRGLPASSGPRPTHAVFALDTDLSAGGKTELERYEEILEGGPPSLGALCVVGRGYWWLEERGWRRWPRIDGETVAFLGGILNIIPHAYAIRREARLAIGSYFIDFGSDIDDLARAIHGLSADVSALTNVPSQDRLSELAVKADDLAARFRSTFDQYPWADGKLIELRSLLAPMLDTARTRLRESQPTNP